MSAENPDDLFYCETHEWLRLDGGRATVGITRHAVDELSDLVHVDLPDEGDELAAGDAFGEIESVKAVSDLNAPVSGTVAEVNESLANDLERLKDDPYGQGWLIIIEGDADEMAAEAEKMMSAEDYAKHIGEDR